MSFIERFSLLCPLSEVPLYLHCISTHECGESVCHQEVDEWEMKKDDIELLDKALGEGAFGAVYKGILQPKVMEKLSRQRKGYEKERQFSMSCVVAVKMLKGSRKSNSIKFSIPAHLKKALTLYTVLSSNS